MVARRHMERTSGILDFGNQAHFGETRDAFVDAAAATQASYLCYERCRNDFMVLASLLDLRISLAYG